MLARARVAITASNIRIGTRCTPFENEKQPLSCPRPSSLASFGRPFDSKRRAAERKPQTMVAATSMGVAFTATISRPIRKPITTTFASLNKETVSLGLDIAQGLGKLPKVHLRSVYCSEAEIYLFGGCITSWKVNGKDLLFVRPDAVFDGQKPISGGIPHCFPQFGPGLMQQHGFARNMDWSIAHSENVEGNPVITLELKDSPYSRSMWDFAFQALYTVRLNSKSLSTEIVVTNKDRKRFSFTSALHTYFRASAASAAVVGLKGCKTLNKDPDPRNPSQGLEVREVVTFPGFVDCIYLDAPSEIHLDNGLGDKMSIKNTNWADIVLWNPHLQMEACYKDFVCVENAKIAEVQLEPGQSWAAAQEMSIA